MNFGLWADAAHRRHQLLQIPLEKLLLHHDMVVGAVGNEWLEKQATRVEAAFRNLTDIHPLFTHLTSPNDPSLVTICEIGEYLKTFMRDPAISTIVSDLRSDKFESALEELAAAYRWLKAGVDVRLHPAVPGGEADFEAIIHELPYVVEVSSISVDKNLIHRLRIGMIVSQAIKDVLKRERPVAVKLRIQQYPTGDVEGRLRGEISSVCKRLAARNFIGSVSEANDSWDIEAEGISVSTENNPFTVDRYARVVSARDHDWDSFIDDVSHPAPEGLPTVEGFANSPSVEHARIFLKFPAQELDPYEKIRKKLKKELRQLRGVRTPRVVVLELTDLGNDIFDLSGPQLRNEILNILRSTPELACVWLLVRKWTTALRHKYFGIYIPNPESVFQVPRSFLGTLLEFEYRCDFLGERSFEISTEEAAFAEYARRNPLRRTRLDNRATA